MVDMIKCNMQTLENDNQTVTQNIHRIEVAIENLEEQKAILMQQWAGEAADTFFAEYTQEINRLRNVLGMLKDLSSYERKSKDTYNDGENKISAVISEISIG